MIAKYKNKNYPQDTLETSKYLETDANKSTKSDFHEFVTTNGIIA